MFWRKVVLVVAASLLQDGVGSEQQGCKCFPGDPCWPSDEAWKLFNGTVGGRLIATTPLASPCHDPNYNEGQCAALREGWLYSGVHMRSPSSIMAPLFANQSCDPFTPKETPCTMGNYVSYTVNATTTQDVQTTIKYARAHNLRLVIRNTGHDYLGRSTGAGALAIWTHQLKDIEILDWDDDTYYGKAMTLGAGVQGFEALAKAKEEDLIVVTGECPTVGVAGGYLQGGGHSGLSTSFGLAADNVLSFNVVTATGNLLTASRERNTDLFWALAGGGGGTYAVVTSVTIKAHPDAPVAGASFSITAPKNNLDKIYDVIDAWHAALPNIIDADVMVIYFFSETYLQIPALTAYNKHASQILPILTPFIDAVAKLGISVEPAVTGYDSYHEHYEKYWGPLPEGNIQVGTMLFGGRLIPRPVIDLPLFAWAAKKIAQMGVTFIGVGTDVSPFGRHGVNSVLPQWRSSIVQASLILPWSFEMPWEEMLARQKKITEEVQPVIEAATPGAGAYVNEADFQQKDWQETFYGGNYKKLREIKKKYDPEDLFYVVVGVGSEEWTVRKDGRMCRAGQEEVVHSEL